MHRRSHSPPPRIRNRDIDYHRHHHYDERDFGDRDPRFVARGGREDTHRRHERLRGRGGYEHHNSSQGRERPPHRDRDKSRERDDREQGCVRGVDGDPSAYGSRRRVPSRSRSRSTPAEDKTKPNFGSSGLLAAATNTVKARDGTSTVLKYNEPPEARKPLLGWRLYVFKGSEQIDLLHIHRQSAYLIGRDRLVADIAVEHPSCSKQHAVIQYRQVQEKDEFGTSKAVIKPFVIDLESTNGTHVNEEAIPVSRFYELKVRDVLKFGLSTREYVLLHDEVA